MIVLRPPFLHQAGRGAGEVRMSGRRALAMFAAITALTPVSCAYQSVPTYSYLPVPCTPTASASSSTNLVATGGSPHAQTPVISAGNAPDGSATSASGGTFSQSRSSCVAAIPEYGYPGGYDPYWDYDWPYYWDYGWRRLGFGGFFGGRFHRDFDDRLRHSFHEHNFHGGRFRGGGFHGRGFHGGRR